MREDSDPRERPSDVDDPVPDGDVDPTTHEDIDPTTDDETRPDNEPLPDYEPHLDDGPAAADPTPDPPAGEASQPTPHDEPGLRHGGEPVPVTGEPVPTAEAHDDPDAQPVPEAVPAQDAEPAHEPQPAPDAQATPEPPPTPAAEPVPEPQPESGPAVLWTDESAHRLRDQWRDVQLRFVDDPRAAADEAQRLVGDAIDELSAALATHRADLDAWATTDPDTEALRMTVRRYRDLLDRLLDL